VRDRSRARPVKSGKSPRISNLIVSESAVKPGGE